MNSISDNIEYQNDVEDIIIEKVRVDKISMGYSFNGSYDIRFDYMHNNNSINNYFLFDKDSYLGINFIYYLNKFDKIPFNFNLGFNYIESRGSDFNKNSIIFGAYKELNNFGVYPVIPFLNIHKTSYYLDDDLDPGDYINFYAGMHIKLIVDTGDKSNLKDVIWISTYLNSTDQKKYSIGFELGLYHPIK
tara:strand:- start:85 stop:654 length:570 start_codon:yes stop_codon:yes gene_type:complete